MVVEILEQDKEGTLEEDLMEVEEVVNLGMVTMGMEEDQEVIVGGLVLVMEDKKAVMEEGLDMATRMGAAELVIPATEKGTMEVRIAIIWELISRNLQSTSY